MNKGQQKQSKEKVKEYLSKIILILRHPLRGCRPPLLAGAAGSVPMLALVAAVEQVVVVVGVICIYGVGVLVVESPLECVRSLLS